MQYRILLLCHRSPPVNHSSWLRATYAAVVVVVVGEFKQIRFHVSEIIKKTVPAFASIATSGAGL